MEDDASVAGHGVEEAAGAGDACVGAVDEAYGQHQGHDCRACAGRCGTEKHFDNGHLRGCVEDGFGVREAEEDCEDEEQATGDVVSILSRLEILEDLRDAPHRYGVDERSWAISSWVGHFLSHVQHHVKRDERQCGLQETQDPGEAIWPSRLVFETRKDVSGIGFVGHGEEDDADDYSP